MSRQGRPAVTAEEPAEGVARFEARAVLGFVALVAGAIPFLALLLLVRQEWTLLRDLDDDVARELNEQVAGSSGLVNVLQVITEFGGSLFAVYVFLLVTAWFWIRCQLRLASYVATTGLGLAVLVPLTKVLVGRPRPQVPLPVVDLPSNASFPSGHAMTSLVTAGMLALVLLPVVRHRWRPVLVAVAVALALVVGFTRLALGVHFVSDVVAGWALGVGWLAVTTAAFRVWQRDHGVQWRPLRGGLDPQAIAGQHPAATGELALPRGRSTVLALAASAGTILVGLSAVGLLLTSVLPDPGLARWDGQGLQQLLALRTDDRTAIARAVSALSGTPMVIALSVAVSVVVLAVRASWRPVLFVATTVLGEVALYFVTAQIVRRVRPDVTDLTVGLPVGASWPSGHVAAAVAVYGALAALVVVYGRSRWRWAVLALPVLLSSAIAVSRVYLAAHHPTDVLAGLVLGALWVLACTRFLLLDGRPRTGNRSGPPASSPRHSHHQRCGTASVRVAPGKSVKRSA